MTRSRILGLRASVVITVAAGTAVAVGCGVEVHETKDDECSVELCTCPTISCNPPFPYPGFQSCPSATPVDGATCTPLGGSAMQCDYSSNDCLTLAVCDGTWDVRTVCPKTTCPAEAPAHGTACVYSGPECSYTGDCAQANCLQNRWEVVVAATICEAAGSAGAGGEGGSSSAGAAGDFGGGGAP